MKTFIISIVLAICCVVCSTLNAQEPVDDSPKDRLQEQIDSIKAEEREALKAEVEAIYEKLENEEITAEEAEQLKGEAAEKRALNIANRVAILENQHALNERNQVENDSIGTSARSISIAIGGGKTVNIIDERCEEKGEKKKKYDRRTTSDLVFAFGLNNVITEGESLDDSPYKIGGSRFAELGWAWKTRVFKETNWLRVKYGLSFQFNGLKPVDNQYFVAEGGTTALEEFPLDLKKSKFRMDNLVVPVHFEFGPSAKKEGDGYFRYSTHKKFKVGVGGYAGLNIGTRQKLKYREDGERVKDKFKDSYNTNNLIYGLSAYAGWSSVGLYIKYDLNPIFKDNPVEERNISLGLRFDLD